MWLLPLSFKSLNVNEIAELFLQIKETKLSACAYKIFVKGNFFLKWGWSQFKTFCHFSYWFLLPSIPPISSVNIILTTALSEDSGFWASAHAWLSFIQLSVFLLLPLVLQNVRFQKEALKIIKVGLYWRKMLCLHALMMAYAILL